jgi:DNA-binding transcriptional ArsR family regulator
MVLKMVGEAAELFKVLGVESRLKMLELLKQRGSIGAKEIARELGITVAAASQHLKILKHIGLVTSKRDGYFIPYSLDEAALEHCTMMMNSICSCPHHPPFHKKTDAEQNDLEHKSIDELKAYKNKLEQKLKRVNRLLNEMRSG